jgi:GxxExxY protein
VPIECLFEVEPISKSRFHEIDYQVMRVVFDTQNELGRLYHESVYQSEVAEKCSAFELSVITEGEILLKLQDFTKSYFIDALVDNGALYELKAVETLQERHEAQLLNYLFLTGLSEGKLVNFSSPSVQYRFVSTTIAPEDRFLFTHNFSEWNADRLPIRHRIVELVDSILKEWGDAFSMFTFTRTHLFISWEGRSWLEKAWRLLWRVALSESIQCVLLM